ncbi:unnamed protein product [Parnassius mnemosyne]
MENYVKFKLVGGKLKLKKGVLPHKFECQKPQKKKIDRPGFKKRQDIEYFERILSRNIGHEDLLLHSIEVVECENQDSNNIQNSDPLNIPEEIDVLSKNNVRSQKTQAVQVNMKPKMKTKSNNTPMKWKQPIVKKKVIPKNLDPNVSFTISNSNSSENIRSFGVNASDNESNDLEITKTMNKNFFNEHMQKGALMAISRDPKLLIGIPAHSYFCIKHLQNFTEISSIEILVTLRKIRWHDPNSMLAIHFGLSESSVTKYFNKTLPKIALCLNRLIIWPSADDVRENLPIAFRKRYSKAISIIDCFEIQIEKPSNASHQAATWSQYKSCNTIKYLISITPDGLINFISEGYGGRTPDSTIFEDSGFLDKLAQGSIVLADRGFKNISHLLEQRGCTLLRPPSVSSNSKLTAEEVLQTKRIAAIRVHVERSIGKLRDFKMIGPHACVDISYIHFLDNIVTIACGLVNLQNCLFSNQV